MAYAALLVVALAPMWLATIPPLGGYPNHLARMHILVNAPDSELLSRFYQVHWAVIPNLAMDLLVPPLAHVMPLAVAGKGFIGLTLIMLSSGALALHYALYRRFSAWPFAVFLLLHNSLFLYGILNFLFGLGLALWGLAAWIGFPARRAWPRALLFYALSLLLFFAHLSALGVFALCALGHELRLYYTGRDSVPAARAAAWMMALALGPGLLMLVLLLSPADAARAEPLFRYGDLGFVASQKLGASQLLFGNYLRILDIATLGIVLWFILYAGMIKRLSLDRRMSWGLAALALAFLLMPFQVFGANFADSRILIALAFLFVATADLRGSGKFEATFALAVVAIFGVRLTVLADRWEQSESAHAEYLRAIEQVPEGSRLLAAWAGTPSQTFEPPLAHLAALAVMKKSVFLPSMYAMPRGQPIIFTPEYLPLAAQAPKLEQWFGSSPAWDKVIDQYDYILLVREHLFSVRPPAVLNPIYEGTDFRLYRTPRTARLAELAAPPI